MRKIDKTRNDLVNQPKKWLVTGCAGFIGSHLVENLLKLNQEVWGLDNFSNGFKRNIDIVLSRVSEAQKENFTFFEGDIRELEVCLSVTKNVDFVLHQAALGSVPRSISKPIDSHDSNVNGALNIFWASHLNKVQSVVYASSSSVYGDSPHLPKVEDSIGKPLSPYAGTKLMNEVHADIFSKTYRLPVRGLRYFNVFGPRQNPDGAYAAVIPRWINQLLKETRPTIFGDGKTSRDFCFIENVVEANLLAAISPFDEELHQVFNVALSNQTTLTELFNLIRERLVELEVASELNKPHYEDFRAGDVRHSLADITKAKNVYRAVKMKGKNFSTPSPPRLFNKTID